MYSISSLSRLPHKLVQIHEMLRHCRSSGDAISLILGSLCRSDYSTQIATNVPLDHRVFSPAEPGGGCRERTSSCCCEANVKETDVTG